MISVSVQLQYLSIVTYGQTPKIFGFILVVVLTTVLLYCRASIVVNVLLACVVPGRVELPTSTLSV